MTISVVLFSCFGPVIGLVTVEDVGDIYRVDGWPAQLVYDIMQDWPINTKRNFESENKTRLFVFFFSSPV